MRHAFVVAQVALAFVLLSAASLLGLSLQRAMAVSPGFQADHVLTGRVPLPGSRYGSRAARLAFVERLDDVLAREPGVLSAGVVTNVPMSGHDTKSAATVARPAGAAPPPHGIYSYGVGGDYFAVMHVPLLEGRLLRPDDSRRDARVCVVDQDFSDYQWPGQRAIGRRLFQGGQAGPDREAFTVVGVVAPVKQAGLTDRTAQGAVYYPYGYFAQNPVFVVARTGLPPESLASVLQRAVRTIDPELPVDDVESMDGRIDDSLLARRSSAAMLTIFAGLALLLTALGTYGVLSYAVAERRREIGVRMALGARPGQVRRQFLAVGVRLLVLGVGIGVAGAWVVGYAMQAVLFDVPPLDPTALAVTTGLMTIVILAGCLLPSRRAARTSPVDALHE